MSNCIPADKFFIKGEVVAPYGAITSVVLMCGPHHPHVRFKGVEFSASRLAYAVANGVSMKSMAGKIVRHTCDNRKCVNKEHLVLLTRGKSLRLNADMDERAHFKGERNNHAKLTNYDVRRIREMWSSGKSQTEIAKIFDVTCSTINQIVNGKTWTHVV